MRLVEFKSIFNGIGLLYAYKLLFEDIVYTILVKV